MNKIDWKRKLSSRKLWAAAAGIVTGLAMVFGLDENTVSTVAGAVVSAASVIAYIMGESKADAAGATGKATGELLESLKEVIKLEPVPYGLDSALQKGVGDSNGNG